MRFLSNVIGRVADEGENINTVAGDGEFDRPPIERPVERFQAGSGAVVTPQAMPPTATNISGATR
jgi:hypothetical protein